jgi:large subunit ribosomal protein L33
MAKKAIGARMIVTIECTEQKGSGIPGMSRYSTYKNKRNTPGKLELMKYNKFMRKHTLHREIK